MKWLNQIPLMRLVTPFCLGIVFCFYHPYPLSNKASFSLFTLVLVLLFISLRLKFNRQFHLRWIFGLITIALYFLLGLTYANFRVEQFSKEHYLNHLTSKPIKGYKATLISEPEKKKNGYRAIIEVTHIQDEKGWHSSTGKALTYLTPKASSSPAYGDQILFFKKPSSVPPPSNFDEFNYKSYLFHHYIYDLSLIHI